MPPSGAQMSRRGRITFPKDVLEVLEKHFKQNPYLDSTKKQHLSEMLGYTIAQIAVWFQNRRMRYKRNKPAKDNENYEKDDVSESASPRKKILSKIRSKGSKRFKKSSGSSQSPLDESMDIQRNTQDSSSHFSDMNLPNVTDGISPRINTCHPQTKDFYASMSTQISFNPNTASDATNQQPKLQFHHSLYIDPPNGVHPPSINLDQTYNMRQNPGAYNSRMDECNKLDNEFNSSYATVPNNPNLEYQANDSQNYANCRAMFSNDMRSNQVNSCHSIYEKENYDVNNLQKDFKSSLPSSEACFTGYDTTRYENTYETPTGFSQHANHIGSFGILEPINNTGNSRFPQPTNCTGFPQGNNHTGNHTVFPQHTKHTGNSGYTQLTGHTGNHTGFPQHTKHTGNSQFTQHTGLTGNHTGFSQHTKHTGNSGFTQNTGHTGNYEFSLHADATGCSGYSQRKKRFIPNQYKNQNFPLPGITANTWSSSTFLNYPNTFNESIFDNASQTPYMHQNYNQQFMMQPNTYFPECSRNPTRLEATLPNEQRNQNSCNFRFYDGNNISSCRGYPDYYNNFFPEVPKEPFILNKENHHPHTEKYPDTTKETDILNWENILSEPMRVLADAYNFAN